MIASGADGEPDDSFSDAVRAGLRTLSPMERKILEADLEAGSPIPAAVLAAELGCSINTLHVSRCNARRKLRAWLESQGYRVERKDEAPQGDGSGSEEDGEAPSDDPGSEESDSEEADSEEHDD